MHLLPLLQSLCHSKLLLLPLFSRKKPNLDTSVLSNYLPISDMDGKITGKYCCLPASVFSS